jgi:uncharacterized repeat protein (TIGR03803 family)
MKVAMRRSLLRTVALSLAPCALFAPTPRLSAQTASFTEATFPAGAQPISSLLQAKDGNIYGVTYSGGTDGYGLIYQLTAAGQYTAL